MESDGGDASDSADQSKAESAAAVDSIIEIVVNSDALSKCGPAEAGNTEIEVKQENEAASSSSPCSPSRPHNDKTSSHRKSKGKNRNKTTSCHNSLSLSERTEKSIGHHLPLYEEEPPTGPNVFYFESDHVALKHNSE